MKSKISTAISERIHLRGAVMTLALLIVMGEAFGQMNVALFTDKSDSVAFAKLQAAIMEIQMKGPRAMGSNARLDSIFNLMATLRGKIIGYKVVYLADKEFTRFEDLKEGKIKPEDVSKLSFADNRLASLPREVFKCTNLTELELVNTSVKNLQGKLRKLQKLRGVYVYNSSPAGHLKLGRNRTVNGLVIRGVKSSNLPKSYKNFKALETLDLSRNIGLTTFPDIYRNRKLRKLNLFENSLTLADLKNTRNESLEELNLHRNKIKVVPDALGGFSKLKKLTFNYNEITAVQPGIANLKKLESLSFYQNKLSAIPSGIFELENLRSIDLYFNQIQNVSAEIARLKGLRILYLSNNQLTSLPESIGELSNLVELYVHNNRLASLPESIKELKYLRVLRINNNYLTSFPGGVLTLKELENLDVSRNSIYQFPTGLSTLSNLQLLNVVGNPWENTDDLEKVTDVLRSRGAIVDYSQK